MDIRSKHQFYARKGAVLAATEELSPVSSRVSDNALTRPQTRMLLSKRVTVLPRELPDLVWLSMKEKELYSVNDLASYLVQPVSHIEEAMRFLVSYGFAESVSRREFLVRKPSHSFLPSNARKLIKQMIGLSIEA